MDCKSPDTHEVVGRYNFKWDLRPGDIAACYGTDPVSRTISYFTASPFGPRRLRIGPSHVAIICTHHGMSTWIESTTLCRHPCLIHRHHVSGAQAHPPDARVRDYTEAGGYVDIYRLSPIDKLSRKESEMLSTILLNHFVRQGVKYDTGGAIISGTRVFKYTRLIPAADLNSLFCSELIAAVMMRLGRMNRDNPCRYNPATLLRCLVRSGTMQFCRRFQPGD